MTTTTIPEATPEKVAEAATAVRAYLAAWLDVREKLRAITPEDWLQLDLIEVETRGMINEANWVLNEVLTGDSPEYVQGECEGFLWLAETPDAWSTYWTSTADREAWPPEDVDVWIAAQREDREKAAAS